jgi:CcmD family protein
MLLLLGLAALALLLPSSARGQEARGAAVEATADPATDGSAAQAAPPPGEFFVAPRSGRAYSHVFLAFGIAWALMLGFVVVLGRRFAAVERDLSQLRAGGPP